MFRSILIFLIGISGIAGVALYGQVTLKSVAEVIDHPVQKGSLVILQIQEYRGTLQWQHAADGTAWLDWEGKTTAELQFTANEEDYVRVAVTSENCDPVYSETVHVIILAGPVVVTTEVTGIAATEAFSGGKVTDDAGKTVTEWGVCWSTEQNPTIDDSKLMDEEMSPEEYVSYIKGLLPDATYYVRAYASTSDGTGYGNQISFKTEMAAGTFTDARDAKEYKWVYIGSQKWMAENLAWLPAVSPPTTGSETEKHYYVITYEGTNVEAAKAVENYSKYGALYNWPAVMDGEVSSNVNPSGVRGACPVGWHVPSRMEWLMLKMYLTENGYGYGGSGFDIGKSLASTSGWDPSAVPGQVGNDQATNNSSGFNGLPAGARDITSGGVWILPNVYSMWWNTTASDDLLSYCNGLYSGYDFLRIDDPYRKSAGMSIRCVAA